MATIDKDFKIKNGLVVEGSTATVNGNQVLTENESDSYIIGLIGGSATSNSTANAVVLRDGNANFAANVITADLVGDVTGTVSDISNHDTDDLSEGTTNKYYTDGRVKDVLVNATKTNISITEVAGDLHITAENGVADSTTDDLDEGTTNKYFTEARVRDSLSGGDGISFNGTTGDISADLGTGLKISGGQIAIDRAEVDTYYDAAGSAEATANALSDHEGLTSGVHGVTGNVVGTTDSQDLSNKRFIDTVYFTDGVTINNEGEIAVRAGSHHFDVQANYGDLNLKTTAAGANVVITSDTGNIVLDADDAAYYGSVSAENEIATHGYVDNAVSGLAWKQAVNLKADSNVDISGDVVGAVIDGHAALTLSDDGYRLLLTGQSTDSENGIWLLSATGGELLASRPADADVYTELIGAAVYVMEGTQYGSTSWVQGDHYLTDFTSQEWTQFSGQGSVTAGTGITVDGLEVSIDRTTVDGWYDAAGDASSAVSTHSGLTTGVHGVTGNVVGTSDSQTLTNKTIDASNNTLSNIDNSSLTNSSITVNGYSTDLGSSVTLDTDDVSEGTNQYFTSQRVRDVLTGSTQTNISITEVSGALVITAENGVDDSTTDDLEEGVTNHYFTDQRAEDAAGNLLAGATKSNIDITYVGGTLTITAENGVAGSDTDDLTEGTSNLYFTDQRALDAVSGSDIAPSAVDINTYRREEATQQVVASASTVTGHTFTGNKSVKYLVRTVGTSGGTLHSQITELLVTVDGNNNAAVTEYGTIYTSGSPLATATMDYSGGEHRLRVTTAIAGAEVVVAATIMSWAD